MSLLVLLLRMVVLFVLLIVDSDCFEDSGYACAARVGFLFQDGSSVLVAP